jgi:hypothetical protein
MEILLPYLVGVGLALGYFLSAIPRRRVPGVKRMSRCHLSEHP